MKHYGRFLIQVTILLATFLLTACHDDNEPTSDPTEQTAIFFMPWSTNMTPYFEQNRCVRDTLMFYSQPDFTQRENITTMLNDVRAIAVGIVIFHRNKFVGNVFWGTIC